MKQDTRWTQFVVTLRWTLSYLQNETSRLFMLIVFLLN